MAYTQVYIRDAFAIISDISKHRRVYMSIFENEQLAYLKELHEKFGTVFTFGMFIARKSETLNDITDCYREEFEKNSDWMKFAFFGVGTEEEISVSEFTYAAAKGYYNYFVRQIRRIAGSLTALDRVTEFYECTPGDEAIRGFGECDGGILGIYTNREDVAYLGRKAGMKLKFRGRCFDRTSLIAFMSRRNVLDVNRIGFPYALKTMAKFFVTLEISESELYEKPMQKKLMNICRYLHKRNYKSDYLMYHLHEAVPGFN